MGRTHHEEHAQDDRESAGIQGGGDRQACACEEHPSHRRSTHLSQLLGECGGGHFPRELVAPREQTWKDTRGRAS